MANASKTAAPAGASKDLPFEEALKKLESIVDAMESGDLPLETMLGKFEEGTKLIKTCQTKLEEAELKIGRLEKDSAGELTMTPMPVSAAE